MASSYVFYPAAAGSTTDYTIPFEYLSQAFVKATVNGASVPFTFLSTYMIRFSVAPVGALKIYRQTSKAPVNTYINGSILVDDQLNGSFLQSLHISEEVAESSMQTATDGAWDAVNLRVKNISAPVNANDAVNKSYVDVKFAADLLEVDADRQAAQTAASAADTSKQAAAGSASAASTSAGNASTSAGNANTSAGNAATSATLASDWASKAEDSPVVTGKFSAFHWAQKAAASAATVLSGLAGTIHAATAKATPVDADEFPIADSAATYGLKRVTWGSIKTALNSVYAAVTHTHPFSDITSKPTNLAGYGITDAATSTHTHAFADLTAKPTTLAGYGITDGAPTPNYGTGNAALAYGAVGTYVWAFVLNVGIIEGNTYAGSALQPAGVTDNSATTTDPGDDQTYASGAAPLTKGGAVLSGTWRAMGRANQTPTSTRRRNSLFLRIS
jgi:hypothetical protein